MTETRRQLEALFRAGLRAADPALLVPRHLPTRPRGRTVVVGAGKASAAMARAFEQAWDGPLEGLVVTRYGHGVACERIEIVEAAHPTPDEAGFAAAGRILDAVRPLTADDLVVALISGGGSSLLTVPAPGLNLADKQALNRALLRSGADIREMNTVRRHVSAIKGGRLAAAAYPARVVTLLISDVPGDDPAAVASGPTVGDPTTLDEARRIVGRYGLDVPASVHEALADPTNETPKPRAPELATTETSMIATPRLMLEAAAAKAASLGLQPLLLGDALEGEARDVGIVHAGIARFAQAHGQPVAAPAAILSGGETTVTVRGTGGKGGRNTEFLLGLALALGGAGEIAALACDSDGIDGSEDNAGAVVLPDTLARMRTAGVEPAAHLERNDAYTAFQAIDDLVVTGPTLTNVNDFRAMLIGPIPGS
ncbi:MAG: glycerate kinase [Pseudomonadota bacterium]